MYGVLVCRKVSKNKLEDVCDLCEHKDDARVMMKTHKYMLCELNKNETML